MRKPKRPKRPPNIPSDPVDNGLASLVAGHLRDALHTSLEKQFEEFMPEMVEHAVKGRGFRIRIEVVQADGTPWVPERRIIMPHEQ